jgi:pilus assembly protein CpaC
MGIAAGNGSIIGTQIGGATVTALAELGLGGLVGEASSAAADSTTAFGIFPGGDFEIVLRALKQNGLARILAEPNLVTISGQRASFLAGGEFPVPVPQGAGGANNAVTIQYKRFGVQLEFLPFVIDEDAIRLSVMPEVSNIDRTIGTTLVEGGDPVPGVRSRRTQTTVELREGQTLAISGVLEVEISADTSRIPLLGDLPYLGPLFSSTRNRRIERELLVVVTPYLVEAMDESQHVPMPGDSHMEPNDCEFYLMNRIEGRTGQPFRSTVEYEWFGPARSSAMQLEGTYLQGDVGFSEAP